MLLIMSLEFVSPAFWDIFPFLRFENSCKEMNLCRKFENYCRNMMSKPSPNF